jgi:hypothetical protein
VRDNRISRAQNASGGTEQVMSNQEDQGARLSDARPRLRRGARFALFAAIGLVLLGASTVVSYIVDALWFASLGLESVFRTRLSLQAATFGAFALVTFAVVYGVYRSLVPAALGELIGTTMLINRRRVAIPVESIQRRVGLALSAAIAALTGASMMQRWMTFALFWAAPRNALLPDPIFGRPLDFYLFTLPLLQVICGWLLLLTLIACSIAGLFVLLSGGTAIWMQARMAGTPLRLWRGLSISVPAGVSGPLRDALRGRHGFFGRHLYGRPCHAGRNAVDLPRARRRRGHGLDRRIFCSAAAPAAGERHSGHGVLSAPRGRALVRQRFHRRTESAGAGAALHSA